MHIDVIGEGPDLILIHGWAMHAGIFAPLTLLLSERFRVHCVDLPGHGYAHDDSAPLALSACATRIAERVPRAVWVGWSLGGLVALTAALEHRQATVGIVEIAASPRFTVAPDWPHGVDADVFAQFGVGLGADYRRTIERFLALEAHGSDQAQAELRELRAHVFERGEPSLSALEQGLQLLENVDLRDRLPQLRVPSLWIAGRRDRLIPAAAMRWASERSPRGKYLEISSGHAPFIAHAREVADAIAAFTIEAMQ